MPGRSEYGKTWSDVKGSARTSAIVIAWSSSRSPGNPVMRSAERAKIGALATNRSTAAA